MKLQKTLAAKTAGVGRSRAKVDHTRAETIKEAITKFDVRKLIRDRLIIIKPVKGTSRSRIRKAKAQKRKGRRKGFGSRKGKAGARQQSKKTRWITSIRSQRELLKTLKQKSIITPTTYRVLYKKAKGGFFRSTGHIKLYIKEHELIIIKP